MPPTDEEIALANRLAEAAKIAGVEIRRAEDIYSPEITLARAMLRTPTGAQKVPDKAAGRFVWLADPRGVPTPQLWFADGQVERTETPIQSHDLKPEDAGLTIDQLTKRYPFVWKPQQMPTK